MSNSTLTVGIRVTIPGLSGTFVVIDWDQALVRLRSEYGAELRVGRKVPLRAAKE